MTDRVDVVVFGATSLTAREVCRQLSEQLPATGLRWAAAGRDAGRVRDALLRAGAEADAVLVADTTDPTSLRALTSQARVLLNLVGPYARYAAPVVDACIATGTDYVDLTGETLFVRDLRRRVDGEARAAGVKIVQPCGFESLPPDLSLGLALDVAAERGLGDVVDVAVEFAVTAIPLPPRPSDVVSGGTIQSLVQMIGEPGAADVFDPALLIADADRAELVRTVSPLRLRPHLASGRTVLAPMVPAPTINPPVLHRSAELLGIAPFRYREGYRFTTARLAQPLAAVGAGAVSGLLGAGRVLSSAPAPVRRPVARMLERVLPGAGYGPAADRVGGFAWTLTTRARTSAGDVVTVDVTADGHPGYLTTARMMATAGLLLATDGATPERAGCLTPLAGLGTAGIDRFDGAGLRFDVR